MIPSSPANYSVSCIGIKSNLLFIDSESKTSTEEWLKAFVPRGLESTFISGN